MDRPVRLFGRFHPRLEGRDVAEVRLRVAASGIPAGAHVDITDLQLQPGRHITGWTLHSSDLDVRPVEGWQWRNGVVYGDATVIVTADTPSASPTRWDVLNAAGQVRVGGYHFGPVQGSASVNGADHTATQGAGIPPHLTERADVDIPVSVEGRARLTCWFRGVASTDPNIDPPPLEAPGPEPIDP